MAIIGVLVLIAAPRFLGRTADAKLTQIQNDVRGVETTFGELLISEPELLSDLELANSETLALVNEEGRLLGRGGPIKDTPTGFRLLSDELLQEHSTTQLDGDFYINLEGDVLYQSAVGYESSTSGNSQTDANAPLSYEAWVADLESKGYVMATDADFSRSTARNLPDWFNYIGTDEYVIIPREIQNESVDSYYRMFFGNAGTSIKGVASNNPNVTNLEMMFGYSGVTSLDLTYFNTEHVTNMREVFMNTTKLAVITGLENFDTSHVENMYGMFNYTRTLKQLDLSSFNTSNVTTMSWMFGAAGVETLDLSGFDTSNVLHMNHMFVNGPKITELNLSSFDTSNVVGMTGMFNFADLDILDVTSFDFSNVTDTSYLISSVNTVHVNSQSAADTLIRSRYRSKNSRILIKDGNDISEPLTSQSSPSFYEWANTLPAEYTIPTDNDFVLSQGNNVPDWFTYVGSDDYIVIPEVIHGQPVDSYYRMFWGSSTIKGVASSNPNVTDIHGMFGYTSATALDVTHLNTTNVTNMRDLFGSSGQLTTIIGLEQLDTSNVTDMYGMFNYTRKLTQLDLSSFNTSKVTIMSWMFGATGVTTLDLSGFDISNVTSMGYMFVNGPKTTTGYARTLEEAERFNTLTNKPDTLLFEVK